jgi:hypothetical protein
MQSTLAPALKVEIKRLIGLATCEGRPDKYAGKRTKSRVKYNLWMEVRRDMAVDEGIQVSMHDISEGGVGFWMRKKIAVGDILFLRDCSDSKPHPWLKVRVSHCVDALKGFLVGGEFDYDK